MLQEALAMFHIRLFKMTKCILRTSKVVYHKRYILWSGVSFLILKEI